MSRHEEFVCGVDAFGPSNLATLLKNIPPYWEPIKSLLYKRAGNPDTEDVRLLVEIGRLPEIRHSALLIISFRLTHCVIG